jgi:hypothetical protein
MSNKYLLVTYYLLLKAFLLFNCHTFFRSPGIPFLKRTLVSEAIAGVGKKPRGCVLNSLQHLESPIALTRA